MKRKKINRGLILTFAVVLGVAVYLVGLEAVRSKDKEEIKKVCEAYLQMEVAYHMLPEEYRKEQPDIAGPALDEYIRKMQEEITSYYVDNEQCYRYLLERLEENLRAQAEGKGVIYQFEKNIRRYESLSFNGNTVKVTFTSFSTLDGPPGGPGSEENRMESQGDTIDEITLQKVDGKWKVVFSNLSYPYGNGGMSYSVERRA